MKLQSWERCCGADYEEYRRVSRSIFADLELCAKNERKKDVWNERLGLYNLHRLLTFPVSTWVSRITIP